MKFDVPLINDSTYKLLLPDVNGHYDFNGLRICNALFPASEPGSLPFAPIPKFRIIPRTEWDYIIKQKDRDGTWIETLVRDPSYGVPCTDQNGLGYCHAYGTVMKLMVQRMLQGHKFIMLSAESVGGPITGWRNQGADPADDMDQICKYGACPQSMMDKEHSLSPSRWQKGWEQEALKYRIESWVDPRALKTPQVSFFDIAVSMCMQNIPGALGYMWWSHYISGPYRVLKTTNGKYALRNRNNWGSDFGDDGFLDMEEGKGTPDWLFGVSVATANG